MIFSILNFVTFFFFIKFMAKSKLFDEILAIIDLFIFD